MSNNKPFIRKIIYIAIIGALLIPLSMISRPETRDKGGSIKDAGGQLSILRETHNLSQAKMSEIDPASETMKLASLGLRGVAVNMLWMQAMEHKKKENYEQLASTLQALTKIQPSFVKVWEYQAHNLAYNVSMEFDDYEYRYKWVKKGIGFLKQGIAYNKRDHRVTDQLGFFTGNKFGKSDEKKSFRRMFNKDEEYRELMSDYIDPTTYYETGFGYDNWKMAYQWYDYSRTLVEEKSCPQYRGDLLFYMWRPAQIRNQALAHQEEEGSSEAIRDIWQKSNSQWIEYGNQKLTNTTGVTMTLEELSRTEEEIQSWRDKLDAFIPVGGEEGDTIKSIREEMMADVMNEAKVPDEDMALLKLSSDERTDEQTQTVTNLLTMINAMDENMDAKLALEVKSAEDKREANKIVLKIMELKKKIRTINKDSGTVNYVYWRARNKAESEVLTKEAHEALYAAKRMWRQSIYDDEYDFDYATKKRTITKKGAISLFVDAFEKWREVFVEYPTLKEGAFTDRLIKSCNDFEDMLEITNREWPEDFPLQGLIDERYESGKSDGLPTTEILEELRSGREQSPDETEAEAEAEPKTEAEAEPKAEAESKAGNGDGSEKESQN
ncbi:MAG: hypothetical protein P8J27_14470 [Mariniblastus sp.]|nr:hypothetical protein [Mariniblastus sp.]